MLDCLQHAITEFIPGPVRLAVDRKGEGPLLVLLHGIGGNRTNWRDQMPVFSRHFTTVAWDARGYGLSDDYAGDLDFKDFARDLGRVLDHYGAQKAHLLGLSMGGRIIQDFYEMHSNQSLVSHPVRHAERRLSPVVGGAGRVCQTSQGAPAPG